MRDKLRDAAKYYHLDDYLFEQVTPVFSRRHTLTSFDFYAIVVWKSNRQVTRVREGLKTRKTDPEALMSQVAQNESDRQRMETLVDIPGIGVPIASAILTVCYPDRFTVFDYRAWEALFHFTKVSSKTAPFSVGGYFDHYLKVRRALAEEWHCTLRELDRTLWGWSKQRGITELATWQQE